MDVLYVCSVSVYTHAHTHTNIYRCAYQKCMMSLCVCVCVCVCMHIRSAWCPRWSFTRHQLVWICSLTPVHTCIYNRSTRCFSRRSRRHLREDGGPEKFNRMVRCMYRFIEVHVHLFYKCTEILVCIQSYTQICTLYVCACAYSYVYGCMSRCVCVKQRHRSRKMKGWRERLIELND